MPLFLEVDQGMMHCKVMLLETALLHILCRQRDLNAVQLDLGSDWEQAPQWYRHLPC